MVFNATGYETPIELITFLDNETLAYGFHVLGIAFMLMITATIFLAVKTYTSTARAFAVTFAVGMVVSFLGWLIGFITIPLFTFYVIGFVASATFLRLESNR
jgi:hypothetical protein